MEKIKSIFQKIKSFVVTHRVWTGVIVIALVLGGWQVVKAFTNTSQETRYITTTVQKGTIISSITASGQVEASNQIDLKPQASGQITYVGVKPGDVVKQGKGLFSINARDAQKAVNNAETSLETAQLELDKFKEAPDNVSVLQIKQAITDAQNSKDDAKTAISDAYKTVLNSSVSATASDLGNTTTPPTVSGTYQKGKDAVITITVFPAGTGSYFTASSVPADVAAATGSISTVVPQPIGDTGLFIKFSTAVPTTSTNWIITLPNKSSPNYSSNYDAYQKAIDNEKKLDASADLTIQENNEKLSQLYQPDALDLRAKELAVKQAQDALDSAKEDLSNYYVTAPFDGVIASVTAKVGDTATGTLGTIITKQKIATLSMNEVDVAKIKLGEKATLTFDAIDDLSMTGEVAEIDTVGTVSSGVVSYSVKIAFDTSDDRVKPGMSVSAAIIMDSKTDVLMVPTSAVKTVGGVSYVQMFTPPLDASVGTQGTATTLKPTQVPVETGISDDSNIEIVSGLNEGDQVVTRTITATTTAAKTTTPSLLGGGTGAGRATGAVRVGGTSASFSR